jgi:hypothetical protein
MLLYVLHHELQLNVTVKDNRQIKITTLIYFYGRLRGVFFWRTKRK